MDWFRMQFLGNWIGCVLVTMAIGYSLLASLLAFGCVSWLFAVAIAQM